ncbi:MAG: aminoacyl-tRNA hydrolase [Bacillales bacterium]|nr:aminoacyl-tRNA hydrolase [Bacillales bacterium]
MTKLFVGLGNPGSKYEKTKHNVGFLVIDELADKLDIKITETKFNGIFGQGFLNGEKVFLLKPLTYMNLSGECVGPFINYFKIDINDIFVVYDDLDINLGQLRIREKGSAGGHNGMKSLIQHLGTQEFKRFRFGIGRPKYGTVVDYVLTNFSKEEEPDLKDTIDFCAKACIEAIDKNFKDVMNNFNRK